MTKSYIMCLSVDYIINTKRHEDMIIEKQIQE